ncbi:hypothetical protein BRARA_A02109 [Brassica rapa]|uniref:Uncharacterized protein n=1 Tax=Brassica campestris TaxID=3711 RepID=A0A398ANT4_BRACM|nr:hypothetical protein BRARA_A02109 [Brassica rapa]
MCMLKKKDSTSAHSLLPIWYLEKFVKGQWDKDDCVPEWKNYIDCPSITHHSSSVFQLYSWWKISYSHFGVFNPTKQADAKESSR